MWYLKIFTVTFIISTPTCLGVPVINNLEEYLRNEINVIPYTSEIKDSSISGRIVNGRLAAAGQFPHQVRLLNYRPNQQYTICGGSIISDEYILTAAHCTKNVVSTTISFGSIDRNKPQFNLVSNTVTVHPDFNPETLNYDVALWKLPRKLTFNDHVKAIKLPSITQISNTFENELAVVSGFGRFDSSDLNSQHLRYAPVRVINNKECAKVYGNHVVLNSTLCVLGREHDEQGPCSGDSGGPLTYKTLQGTDILVGVTSFVSTRGCGLDRPTGYARVTAFLDWIQKHTGIILV